MDAVLLTQELTTLSSVRGAAERTGVALETAATVDSLVSAVKGDEPRLVILDLATPKLDLASLVPHLRDLLPPTARVIAFGSHVHELLLEAARQAGCDEVLSRGRFHNDMNEIVATALRD
jgi:DNA-binding NarL/FixJ family response regulator